MTGDRLRIVRLLAAVALVAHGASAQVPEFKDYPADAVWHGATTKPRMKTREERMYRSQFRRAANKPPNFAAHYRVTIWGCGTQCFSGGIVDLQTGTVLPIPGASKEYAKDWVVCSSAFVGCGVETHLDSSLLVLRCADVIGRDGGNYIHTSYFVLDDGRFKTIAQRTGRERVF